MNEVIRTPKMRACSLVLVLYLTANPTWGQNLVVNGGFETGDFSGWQQGGDTGFTTVVASGEGSPPIASPEGGNHARMGPYNNGRIFQDFTTVAGAVYDVQYYLHAGQDGDSNRHFRARIGDSSDISGLTVLENLTNPALFAFTLRTFTFTATSTTTQIRFNFENDPDFWRLDGVDVRRKVPELDAEEATIPLVLMVTFLLALRRRRLVSTHGQASEG